MNGPSDSPEYLHLERSGRFLTDALDTRPEALAFRATVAARKTAWTEGDTTVPPGVWALLDEADAQARKKAAGRQAGMFR